MFYFSNMLKQDIWCYYDCKSQSRKHSL